MEKQHSDSHQKRKWRKIICPNCLMNFIKDPGEKLCKDCVDDICDGILTEMEDEERRGEKV